MGDTKLLPCPFCGETPYMQSDTDVDGCYWSKVRCKCGVTTRGKWASSSANTCPQFYAEVRDEWNTRHGPALLARQEGEDRLRDLHHAIRLVYGCVPDLPIDESTMDAATDALHNFCLMVGIHEVDVDSPIDEAARSGGGG